MSPNLYIIAGPNGAGKTTFAREFLPIDNSGATPVIVAFDEQGKLGIMDRKVYEKLIARYDKP